MWGYTLRWLISFSFGNRSSKRRANLRPLADQHQRFGVMQPLRQRIDVLDVVVPDRDVVSRKLGEAIEGAHRVEIIVKNGDLHDGPPPSQQPGIYFTASNSTSNISVAFGGMTPPAPRAP